MGWKFYDLDRVAQKLVIEAKKRDDRVTKKSDKSLNQSHKMRLAVAYGLERFWGEHLRLERNDANKSQFWKQTWTELVNIPDDPADKMPDKLWALDLETQRVALAVLAQLCDAIVWWTQRYKTGSDDDAD
jgi:hypothetical protein